MAITHSANSLSLNPLANILAYQFAWFACILSAAKGLPWIGTVTALLVVAWHVSSARRPKTELVLIAAAGAIGLSWESLLVQTGWIAYPSGNMIPGLAPHWIVALWLVFATTFNVSLKWFKKHLDVVALFGFIGGPLAFYAGSALGALTLTPELGLAAIAVGWGLLMPILMLLARRFDGVNPLPETIINP
jgi:hypothetical protein